MSSLDERRTAKALATFAAPHPELDLEQARRRLSQLRWHEVAIADRTPFQALMHAADEITALAEGRGCVGPEPMPRRYVDGVLDAAAAIHRLAHERYI